MLTMWNISCEITKNAISYFLAREQVGVVYF